MEIKRNGSQPSGKGPAEYFTGAVRIDPLFEAREPARILGARPGDPLNALHRLRQPFRLVDADNKEPQGQRQSSALNFRRGI